MNQDLVKLGLVVGVGIVGTAVAGPAGGAALVAAAAASCAPAKDYQQMKKNGELTKKYTQKFKDAYNEKHS